MLQKIISLLKPEVSPEAKLTGISLHLGKELEGLDSRLRTQEIRSLLHGKDGEDGKDGKDGKTGAKGPKGDKGDSGKDGKDGKDGLDGKDGVSVVDSWVAADDHLVIKLSNGEEVDAGVISGGAGSSSVINTQVARDQITVSSTAPASPYIGQLWYDIS